METMLRRKIAAIVISAIVLIAVAIAAFLIGERSARLTARYAATITDSNGTYSEGCVKPDKGKEVCGAFVSAVGGGQSRFVAGAKVSVEQGKVDQRIVLLLSIEP